MEWAQCANPRAPRSASEAAPSTKSKDKVREGEGTAYECGEAAVYKADAALETKKGDKASHVITFLTPPNPECWAGEAPPPPVERDAGTKPPEDAGASADAGPATDAGATSTDAGAAKPTDAGAK